MALSDPRLQRFAFAKLVGQENSYAIRKYEFQMGRASKNSTLDVALSPENMNVSRLHAKIVFDFRSRFFELVVVGKNGVHLNGVHITPPSDPSQPQSVPLHSQDILVLSDKTFCFLLPKNSPHNPPRGGSAALKRPSTDVASPFPPLSSASAQDDNPASKRFKGPSPSAGPTQQQPTGHSFPALPPLGAAGQPQVSIPAPAHAPPASAGAEPQAAVPLPQQQQQQQQQQQ
mmetsp:Transcript_18175/g.47440  ORF Transcript_18175/g.47440 Transcript_18175/m.47440 type:complete len:230 (-) Transcript_18175:673-1362(-)|eukprot:CAMPEP_0202344516 /NCGR_PEP_ID=MMETSP1126-20121109/4163_1 /ASSEMBLY_ACC=CAM_ASM_000457 /TAXON_ID=3047 /ORGANISM="Dunaliella tertiolecta, Strain CCMP1320" /LENGTH=229 /DNA_ID=CAMNT_0048935715 /DNA_START=38 /DNA_END=727 /DNA_ORIENTATION=-